MFAHHLVRFVLHPHRCACDHALTLNLASQVLETPEERLEASLAYMKELGFDEVACAKALVAERGNVERATMALLESTEMQTTSKEQRSAFHELRSMGFGVARR